MTQRFQQQKELVIEEVISHIKTHVPEASAGLVTEFAYRFFEIISPEDLLDRDVSEWSGLVFSLWKFVFNRQPGEQKIRVYNPTYEKHGWESTHTIIEVSHDDMPFLVDSILMEVNSRGLLCHLVMHVGVFNVVRNAASHIEMICDASKKIPKDVSCEAVIYIEVDRQTDDAVLEDIQNNLTRILGDVSAAVHDWKPMLKQMQECLDELEKNPPPVDQAELEESKDFIKWVMNNHFTLLGCREYELVGKGEEQALKMVKGSGLGVLRSSQNSKAMRYLSELPKEVRKMTLSKQILIIAKTNTRSTVHRSVYTDYIGVKRFDKNGKLIGEKRFIGLYTSAAYHSNPKYIPFLRQKVAKVLQRSRLSPSGHSGKALINILETLPRDDLFQASDEELYDLSVGILHLQERQRTRLFVRRDSYGRFYSCLVYVPREHFHTDLRRKFQAILMEEFNGIESSFSTQFTESILARIHIIIRVDPHEKVEHDVEVIERKIIQVARSWRDELRDSLTDYFGEAQGTSYFNKYRDAFPASYQEQYSARTAVSDIEHFERLSEENPLEMSFHSAFEDMNSKLQFKLFNATHSHPISDVLPILEDMGLRVLGEQMSRMTLPDGSHIWTNDFEMVQVENKNLEIEQVAENFQEAFSKIWFSQAEDDSLNRLVLEAKLTWKETALLRAYARYLKQVGFTFSQDYIAEALYHNPDISRMLVQLFKERFDPKAKKHDEKVLNRYIEKIEKSFDSVASLDEDRILRRILDLILATVRTNYYIMSEDGDDKPYLSLKFKPEMIPELPLPKPMFEIFVYSPRVEGVHLRGAKVARGGLRWSDRREDFRTEILGLMKAQQVKNAVIVPMGAKGGFVCKMLPMNGEREEVMAEVIESYSTFIRGMLDITDNIVEGEVVHPENVVIYDEEDPYLVVAADKGTATFSDIANGIAKEYGFWLDDAFASGGSAGYDHKKMGITARGAWESVKRHFREMNLDTQKEDFTAIGIGDMAGDVFGNGMLCSRHIKLVAAFNHQHIFIDPDPDSEKSYLERERLFKLPRSGWSDYNPDLISTGGGVFSRSEKSIPLSPEIKDLLGLKKDKIEPNLLLQAILKADVDLFWNGGIGTFVKSSIETHADAGDRTNDAIRIDANELRAKVIGEGGNLGFTQKARVEFSLNSGRINTDAIDNSAGVDCSDHEVNIKILLNKVVAEGDMTIKQRNELLSEMTDEVAELVLNDNYLQTETLSLEEYSSLQTVDLFRRYVSALEKEGYLNRELENLPSDEEIKERNALGQGFTRPEIAVLMAYDKILLKQQILDSELPEEPYFIGMLEKAFPKVLRERYSEAMVQHPLRREIIATQLSNAVTNAMGINFISRLQLETGASISFIVRAYVATIELFDISELWGRIRALDCEVETDVQFSMILQLYFLIRRSTRWFLRNYDESFEIETVVGQYKDNLRVLKQIMPEVLMKEQMSILKTHAKEYIKKGVPESLADEIARSIYLFHALDILEATNASDFELQQVGSTYYLLSMRLELNWMREKIMLHGMETQWDELARSSLLDDIDLQQRILTLNVLGCREESNTFEECFDKWSAKNCSMLMRWERFLADMRSTESISLVMFTVGLRELVDLSHEEVLAKI
ncbi:MAG: NAD-glutamate dehydrogenase [Gammaproteobacteria bacterium]